MKEFDHSKFQQKFENDCKDIVDEIQEKFIDLGVENHSAYGENIKIRQERLENALEKMNFEFKTNCLDLPQQSGSKDYLNLDRETIEQIESTEASMGKDLDQIFDILNDRSGYE